jgi:hypothetical protein
LKLSNAFFGAFVVLLIEKSALIYEDDDKLEQAMTTDDIHCPHLQCGGPRCPKLPYRQMTIVCHSSHQIAPMSVVPFGILAEYLD